MVTASSGNRLEGRHCGGILQNVTLLTTDESIGGVALGLGDTAPVIPWTGLTRIRATFSGPVLVGNSDLTVNGVAVSAHPVTAFDRTYDATRNVTTATWTVPTLDPSASNLAGDRLALQFHNSIQPADGTLLAGGDLVLNLDLLIGDITRDGVVDSADVSAFATAYAPDTPQNPFALADFDLNGWITAADAALLNAASNAELPFGTPGNLIEAPSALTVTGATRDTIALRWTTGGTGAVRVERRDGPGCAFAPVAELTGGTTTFVDAGLEAGTAYTYQVVTISGSIESHASAAVSASTRSSELDTSALSQTMLGVEVLPASDALGGYTLGLGSSGPLLPWSGLTRIRATFSGNVYVTSGDMAPHGVRTPDYAVTHFTRSYDATADLTTAVWQVSGLNGAAGDRVALQFHNSIFEADTGLMPGPDLIVGFSYLPGFVTPETVEPGESLVPSALPYPVASAFSIYDTNLDGHAEATEVLPVSTAASHGQSLPAGSPAITPSAPWSLSSTVTATGSVSVQWAGASGMLVHVLRARDQGTYAGYTEIGTCSSGSSFADPDPALLRGTAFLYQFVAEDPVTHLMSVPSAPLSVSSNASLEASALAGVLTKVEMVPADFSAPYTVSMGPGSNWTLPWATVTANTLARVRATFDGQVDVDKEDLIVSGSMLPRYAVGPLSGDSGDGFTVTYDGTHTLATWSLPMLSGMSNERLALQFGNAIQVHGALPVAGSDFVVPVNIMATDFNGNGVSDSSDAILFATWYNESATLEPFNRMDVVRDGYFTSSDAILFATYYSPGNSLPSQLPVLAPVAPSSLQAGPAPSGGVLLTWTHNAQPAGISLTGSIVQRSADGVMYSALGPAVTSNSYVDSSAQDNVTYHYRLIELAGTDSSVPSAPIAVTTSPGSLPVTLDANPPGPGETVTVTGNEGAPVTLSGMVTGNIAGTWSAIVEWGDGTAKTTVLGDYDGSFSADHTFADNAPAAAPHNGLYHAEVQIVSSWGAGDHMDVDVAIANVAPTADLTVTDMGNGSGTAMVAVTNVQDPSSADMAAPFTYRFDFDNDGIFEVNPLTASASHAFSAQGTYIIRARVEDKDGGHTDVAQTVYVIANASGDEGGGSSTTFMVEVGPPVDVTSPLLVSRPAPSSVDEGQSPAPSLDLGSFSDPTPDAGPYIVQVNWGDGSDVESFPQPGKGNIPCQPHVYDDNGSYLVSIRVTNKYGVFGTTSFPIKVKNKAPDAGTLAWTQVAGQRPVATEGTLTTVTVTDATDKSKADSAAGFLYSFDTGSGFGPYTNSSSVTFTPTTHGDKTIAWKVKDKDGAESQKTTTLAVADGSFDAWIEGPTRIVINTDCTIIPTIHDLGIDSPASLDWVMDWGDGSATTQASTPPAFTHQYATPGDYRLQLSGQTKGASSSRVVVSNFLDLHVVDVLPAPTDLWATATASSVNVHWDYPAATPNYESEIDSYRVWMESPNGPALVGVNYIDSSGRPPKDITLNALDPNATYTFFVTAQRRGEDSPASPHLPVTTQPERIEITSVTHFMNATPSLIVRWPSGIDIGQDRFVIELYANGAWTVATGADNIGTGYTSWIVDGLQPMTTYTVRLAAYKGSRLLGASALQPADARALSEMTHAVALAPTVTSCVAQSNPYGVIVATGAFPTAPNLPWGVTQVAHFEVQLKLEATKPAQWYGSPTRSQTDWDSSFATMIPGKDIPTRVRSWYYMDATPSVPSAEQVISPDYSSTILPSPPTLPSPDLDLVYGADGTTAERVTWGPGTWPADGYDHRTVARWFVFDTRTDSWTPVDDTEWESARGLDSKAVGQLNPGKYRFIAQNVATYSADVNGTLKSVMWGSDFVVKDCVVDAPSAPSRPTAPTDLVAETWGTTSVKLTWQPGEFSTPASYDIERSRDGIAWSWATSLASSGSSSESTVIGGLEPGVKYYFRVRETEVVSSANVYSDYSVSDSARTQWQVGTQADPSRVHEGQSGEFEFYRIGMVDASLDIDFTLPGNGPGFATNGIDYKHAGGLFPTSAHFPLGSALIAHDANEATSTGLGYDVIPNNDGTEAAEEIVVSLNNAELSPSDTTTRPAWARDGRAYTDIAVIPPGLIDVDIDSDNNNGLGDPSRSDWEDQIESGKDEGWIPDAERGETEANRPTYPGKLIVLNNGDDDHDGIPNYADGYDHDGSSIGSTGADDRTTKDEFVPLVVELPNDVTMYNIQSVTFRYSSSEPNFSTQGSGTVDDPYIYPASSGLRLWTSDRAHGALTRTLADVRTLKLGDPSDDLTGYDVREGTYSGEDLKRLGFFSSPTDPWCQSDGRKITLFVEAVGTTAGQTFSVTAEFKYVPALSWQSPGVACSSSDTVVFTTVSNDICIDSDNTSKGSPEKKGEVGWEYQDQVETKDGLPGKVIVVHDSVSGTSGKPDFMDRSAAAGSTGAMTGLVPVLFTFASATGTSNLVVNLDYDAAPLPLAGNTDIPTHGHFRLWTLDGRFIEGGHYDSAGSDGPTHSLAYLGYSGGATLTLMLEAVSATTVPSAITLTETSPSISVSDSVNVTSVQDYAAAAYSGAIRLADGTVWLAQNDLQAAGWDLPWGHTQTITSAARPGLPNLYGNGGDIAELPRLVQATGTIIAVVGGDTLYFDYDGTNYAARFGRHEQLMPADSSKYPEYFLTDPDGGQYKFTSFDPQIPASFRGVLGKYTGPGGKETTIGNHLISVTQGATTFSYLPFDSGSFKGMLKTVTWAAANRSATYTYYGPNDPYGLQGDLKLVEVKEGNAVVGGSYYRYDKAANTVFGPGHVSQAYQGDDLLRLRAAYPSTADDNGYLVASSDEISKFASYRFDYDGYGRVANQWVQGTGQTVDPAAACATQGHASYDYVSSRFAVGTNNWAQKISEAQHAPSGVAQSANVTYVNFAGQPMFTNGSQGLSFTRYDSHGRVRLSAAPSAIDTSVASSSFADILNNTSADLFDGLFDGSGLITKTEYYGKNDPNGKEGYLKSVTFLNGDTASPVPHSAFTYVGREASHGTLPKVTIQLLKDSTVYADSSGASPLTTSTEYGTTWADFQPLTVKITPPVVRTNQNGSGQTEPTNFTYDEWGHLRTTSAGASKTRYEYDPLTALVIETIVADGTLNLRTTIDGRDGMGRIKKAIDPNRNATTTEYKQSDRGLTVIVTPPAEAVGRTAAPRTVTQIDTCNGYIYSYTIDHDTTAVRSLARTKLDLAGRPVYSDRYHELAGVTLDGAAILAGNIPSPDGKWGAEGPGNYDRTIMDYDQLGRQYWTRNAVGTIRATDFDGLGRPVAQRIGTTQTGPKTTVQVNDYDIDSNLTSVTLKPDGNSAHNRVTTNVYDWRGRLVASKQGDNSGTQTDDVNRPLMVSTYDNLNQVTATYIFDGDGIDVTSLGKTGAAILQAIDGNRLRALTATSYDARERVYAQVVFNIDQTTGAIHQSNVGTAESPILLPDFRTTGTWYNPEGLVMKTATSGEAATKCDYDQAGRVSNSWLVDPTNGAVISKQHVEYDADSQVISTATTDYPSVGGAPRTSYTASWYDTAQRVIAVANAGTSSSVLVTRYEYLAAGELGKVIDPKGISTYKEFDAAGRMTAQYENYVAGDEATTDQNRKTVYAYTGLDQVKSIVVRVIKPGAPSEDQTTTYRYGATIRNADQLDSNDLLVAVYLPAYDKSKAATADAIPNRQQYVYDALGEVIQFNDSSAVVHYYTYDVLGRQTVDRATARKGTFNATVQEHVYGYDTLGRMTSAQSKGASAMINAVTRTYDGYGDLLSDSVSGQTVTYGYDYRFGRSRLMSIIYPKGTSTTPDYSVNYVYGCAGSLDDNISRVARIEDNASNFYSKRTPTRACLR